MNLNLEAADYRGAISFRRMNTSDNSPCIIVNDSIIKGGMRTYKVFDASGKEMPQFCGEYEDVLCLIELFSKIQVTEETEEAIRIIDYIVLEIGSKYIYAVECGEIISI